MGKSIVFYARKPYANVVDRDPATAGGADANAQEGVAA